MLVGETIWDPDVANGPAQVPAPGVDEATHVLALRDVQERLTLWPRVTIEGDADKARVGTTAPEVQSGQSVAPLEHTSGASAGAQNSTTTPPWPES